MKNEAVFDLDAGTVEGGAAPVATHRGARRRDIARLGMHVLATLRRPPMRMLAGRRPPRLRTLSLLPLAAALLVGPAQAQVYKWVGPDGKVNYGDVPPPPSAVRAQKKNFPGNVVDTGDMPFALAEAVRNSPVILYTGAKCAPCDLGRKLLSNRGIPFSEKTVSTNADIALLGNSQAELPQLQVGSARQAGYEALAWNARLSAAGYPESSKLPGGYRNPAPSAAVPGASDIPGAAADSASDAAPGNAGTTPARPRKQPQPRSTPAQPGETTPPGFRF